jgi:hypothetical protein
MFAPFFSAFTPPRRMDAPSVSTVAGEDDLITVQSALSHQVKAIYSTLHFLVAVYLLLKLTLHQ